MKKKYVKRVSQDVRDLRRIYGTLDKMIERTRNPICKKRGRLASRYLKGSVCLILDTYEHFEEAQ